MERLISFLNIDDQARQDAKAVWSLIEDYTDEIMRDFYADIRRVDPALIDGDTIDRLATKQKEHWKSLLNDELDQSLFNRMSLVGIKHREVGLDPKWYIAGYHKIKLRFSGHILASPLSVAKKISLVSTLDRFVALDMALALSSYSSWLVD